jgi:hypothetical protein
MNQRHWLAVVYMRCDQTVQGLFLLHDNNIKQVAQIANPADIIPTNLSRLERNVFCIYNSLTCHEVK